MRLRQYLLITTIFLLVASCKKDKLEGDYEIFVGKWKWLYTDHNYGWCDGDDYFEEIVPGDNYSLEFEKKGKVHTYENDKLLESYRVVFDFYMPDNKDFYDYIFSIKLNNKDDKTLTGGFKSDTLILLTFPFDGNDECELYMSFFLRE